MLTSPLGTLVAAVTLGVALACGSGGNSGAAGTGMFAVDLMDAPATGVEGIVVTIADVTVHSNQSGWVNVFDGPLTVDLLTLQTTARQLGAIPLPAGEVTQIRLDLTPSGPQYVLLSDGTQADLVVPSGTETGVKLNGPFEVTACDLHTVTLDFDGENSIQLHETGGGSANWILRPVIRVRAEADAVLPCSSVDAGQPVDG